MVKHNGPFAGPLPPRVAEPPAGRTARPRTQAPLEAQLAAIADDVAYTNHDLDDGLRAGFLELAELRDLALGRAALAEVERRFDGIEPARRVHETHPRG